MNYPYFLDGRLPFIQVFGISIPTYYPIISLSFCVCLLWLTARARQKDFDLRIVIDTALIIMFAGFVGARLMHVLFEDFEFYRQYPIEVLKFWNGGFVFYGGAFSAVLCGLIFLKMKREALPPWLDLYAPVAALGYALGRIACFATGCCFGEVCELIANHPFRHPTQLYAVIIELISLGILLKIEKRVASVPGFLFGTWIFLHALGRIFMESLRADPRGPMPLDLSISTWISLVLLLFSSVFLSLRFKKELVP